ncbi:MAG: type II toxin-antitoxin system HicB family antitoxin [Bryobacteraceae bacterium]|nr:type II toxin-antitoxin system HicB family antitoxin [Bryobacteraceae bacterium]
MFSYSALFEPEDGGYVVTFPDVPEVVTQGESMDEAMAYAADALTVVLDEYIRRRRPLPKPSKPRGKKMRVVRLPALVEAKLALYEQMRAAGMRKADIARRLGWQRSQVDRLLNLSHASRLDQIEAALMLFGKTLIVAVGNAA